jgi:hypothetical protein
LVSEWEFFFVVVVDFLCLYFFLGEGIELVVGLVRIVDGAGAVCCVAVGVAVGCGVLGVVIGVVVGVVIGGTVGVVVDVSLGSAVACEVGAEVEVVA